MNSLRALLLLASTAGFARPRIQCVDERNSSKSMLQLSVGYNDITEFDISTIVDTTEKVSSVTYSIGSHDTVVLPTIEDMENPTRVLNVSFPDDLQIDQVLSPGGDSIVYIYNKSTTYILRVDSAFDHKVSFFKIDLNLMATEGVNCIDADYHSSLKRLLILCKPLAAESMKNAFIFVIDLDLKRLENIVHIPHNSQGFNLSQSAQLALIETSDTLGIYGTILLYNQRYQIINESIDRQPESIDYVQYCRIINHNSLILECNAEYILNTKGIVPSLQVFTDILVMPNSDGFSMVGYGDHEYGTQVIRCHISFPALSNQTMYCVGQSKSLVNSTSISVFMNYPYILIVDYEYMKLQVCFAMMGVGLSSQIGECQNVDLKDRLDITVHVRDAVLSDNLIHLSLTSKLAKINAGYMNVNYWDKHVKVDLVNYAGIALGRSLMKYKHSHDYVKVSQGGPPIMTLSEHSCPKKSCELTIVAYDYENLARCYMNVTIIKNYSDHIGITKEANSYKIDMLYGSHFTWPVNTNSLHGNALKYDLKLTDKLQDLAHIDIYHASPVEIDMQAEDRLDTLFFQVAAGPNYLIGLTIRKELAYYSCLTSEIDKIKCRLSLKSAIISPGKLIYFGISGQFGGDIVYLELRTNLDSKFVLIDPSKGFIFSDRSFKEIYAISATSSIDEIHLDSSLIALSTDTGLELWSHRLGTKKVQVQATRILDNLNLKDTYMARSIHFVVDPILNLKVLLVVSTAADKQVWLQYIELYPPYSVIRSMKLPYFLDSVYACPTNNKLLIAGKKSAGKDWDVVITTHWFNSISYQRVKLDYILANDTVEELVCLKSTNLAAIVSKNAKDTWKTTVLYTNQMASKQIHSIVSDQTVKPLIFENSLGLLHLRLKFRVILNSLLSYENGPFIVARVTGTPPAEIWSRQTMDMNFGGLAELNITNLEGKVISDSTYVNIIFQNTGIAITSRYPPELTPGIFSLDRLADIRGSVEEVSLSKPVNSTVEFSPRYKIIKKYTTKRNNFPVSQMEFSGNNKLVVALYDKDIKSRKLIFLIFDMTVFMLSVQTKVAGDLTDMSAFTTVDNDIIVLFGVPSDYEKSQYLIRYVVVSPIGYPFITEFKAIAKFKTRPKQLEITAGSTSIIVFVRIDSKLLIYYLPMADLMNRQVKWQEIGEFLSCDGFSYALTSDRVLISYYSKSDNQIRNVLYDINGPPVLLKKKVEIFSKYSNTWIDCLKLTHTKAVCVVNTKSAYMVEYQVDFEEISAAWRYLEKYNDTDVTAISLSKNFIVGYAISTSPGIYKNSLQVWRRYYGEWTSRTIKMYSLIPLQNPAQSELYRNFAPFTIHTSKGSDKLDAILAVATNDTSAPIDFYELSIASVTVKASLDLKPITLEDVNLTFKGMTTISRPLYSFFMEKIEEPVLPKPRSWSANQSWIFLVGVFGTALVMGVMVILYCCSGEREVTYDDYIKKLNEADPLEKNEDDIKFASFSSPTQPTDTAESTDIGLVSDFKRGKSLTFSHN